MWRSLVPSHNRNTQMLNSLDQLGDMTPKHVRTVSEVDNGYNDYREDRPIEREK
jgi:hypothetical protein